MNAFDVPFAGFEKIHSWKNIKLYPTVRMKIKRILQVDEVRKSYLYYAESVGSGVEGVPHIIFSKNKRQIGTTHMALYPVRAWMEEVYGYFFDKNSLSSWNSVKKRLIEALMDQSQMSWAEIYWQELWNNIDPQKCACSQYIRDSLDKLMGGVFSDDDSENKQKSKKKITNIKSFIKHHIVDIINIYQGFILKKYPEEELPNQKMTSFDFNKNRLHEVPLLYDEDIVNLYNYEPAPKDIEQLYKVAIGHGYENDPKLVDTAIAFSIKVPADYDAGVPSLAKYNPHAIIITDTKKGKSALASRVGYLVEGRNASAAGLLGFATADSVNRGKLDGLEYSFCIDEVNQITDQNFVRGLYNFVEMGYTDITKGKGDIRSNFNNVIWFIGNHKSRFDTDDQIESFAELIEVMGLASPLGSRIGYLLYEDSQFSHKQSLMDYDDEHSNMLHFKSATKSSKKLSSEEIKLADAVFDQIIADYVSPVFLKAMTHEKVISWLDDKEDWKKGSFAERLRVLEKKSKNFLVDTYFDVYMFLSSMSEGYRHQRGMAVRLAITSPEIVAYIIKHYKKIMSSEEEFDKFVEYLMPVILSKMKIVDGRNARSVNAILNETQQIKDEEWNGPILNSILYSLPKLIGAATQTSRSLSKDTIVKIIGVLAIISYDIVKQSNSVEGGGIPLDSVFLEEVFESFAQTDSVISKLIPSYWKNKYSDRIKPTLEKLASIPEVRDRLKRFCRISFEKVPSGIVKYAFRPYFSQTDDKESILKTYDLIVEFAFDKSSEGTPVESNPYSCEVFLTDPNISQAVHNASSSGMIITK